MSNSTRKVDVTVLRGGDKNVHFALDAPKGINIDLAFDKVNAIQKAFPNNKLKVSMRGEG